MMQSSLQGPGETAEATYGKHKQLVERVRRMSVEVAPQELTDTPSLSLRSKSSYSGSLQGLQMSMQTTVDLVLLLLDDIDAGRGVDPLQTEQLRSTLLSNDDLQQPLILRDLKRTHARNASYTGSTVLSFLEQSEAVRHAMSSSSSYKSFRLSSASLLGDRSHSFAIGQAHGGTASATRSYRLPSLSESPTAILSDGEDVRAAGDNSAAPAVLAKTNCSTEKGWDLQDSHARLNSGLIRNFVRGARAAKFGELPPVQESGLALSEGSTELTETSLPASLDWAPELPGSSQRNSLDTSHQPVTPQKSSESAQPTSTDTFADSEQPQDYLEERQPRESEADGRRHVSVPAEASGRDSRQLQDTEERDSQPGVSGTRYQALSRQKAHTKSMPLHSSAASLRKLIQAGPVGTKPRKAWQDTQDESEAATLPGVVEGEDSVSDRGAWSEQEQLLKPLISRARDLLAEAGNWGFDTFELAEVTDGRPLSTLAFVLIQRHGLIKTLNLDEQQLITFLLAVEDRYQANAYHNRAHAADVLHTVYCTLCYGGLAGGGFVSNLEVLACCIAAIVHDVDHPGLTNDCLVASSNELATRYNDRSVLENHHCCTFSRILHDPELDCNFLQAASKSEQQEFRAIVMEMVLATDMKQHFALVAKFRTLITHSHTSAPSGQQSAQLKWADSLDGMVDLGHRLHSMPAVASLQHLIRLPHDLPEAQRSLVFQIILKNADLGHLSHPFNLHKKWLDGLEQELFAQGDFEAGMGLPMTPFMDRSLPGISSRQVSFFKLIAIPLLAPFVLAFPGCQPLLDGLMSNYSYWCTTEEAAAKEAAPPAGLVSRSASLHKSHSLSPLASPKRASFGTVQQT